MDQRTSDVQINQPLFSTTFWSWPTYMYSTSSCRTEYAGFVIEGAALFQRERVSEKETDRDKEIIPHTQGCIDVAETSEIDGEVEEEGEAELISGDKASH
uniref:Uncharacterized protein n=1 Tax=Timema monikensis TaxID=170555 RepID=A0A7R9EJH3_9NEOP|nr:unnamed protein product [Timema monikensis]